jgi:hypothetical protein
MLFPHAERGQSFGLGIFRGEQIAVVIRSTGWREPFGGQYSNDECPESPTARVLLSHAKRLTRAGV